MNRDLELYRIFCEVVKYKNISKTAENLYISQSAITQSIQKLESQLGGNVFYRNKNGVELTEEGKNLYEYIKDSIETMNNAENIFSKYITLEKGKIRIGGGNSLINSLILTPMLNFIKKYPNVDISINSGITESLIQKLTNGELDLVVLNLPFDLNKYSNIVVNPLKKAKYCLFCSKEYKKDNNIENIKDIEKCKIIAPKTYSSKSQIFNTYIKNNNLNITSNYEVSSTSIMKKMITNNVGVGFAKMDSINDISKDIFIIEEFDTNEYQEGIITLKKNMVNKATQELVKEIKEYYKQN